MPVLESTDGGAQGAALRCRALDEIYQQRSIVTTAAHPFAQRSSRARPRPADDDLISEWKRGDAEESDHATNLLHEIAPQRKMSQPVRRASRPSASMHRPLTAAAPRSRLWRLLFPGLGILSILGLWTLLTVGMGWWHGTMDTLHYGYPRTFQIDAVVGHNDSRSKPSHFIALNLHGRIEIIEFPAGDGVHARIYLGPRLSGSDADKALVTLKFADVNGDKQIDMLVFFQSSWAVFMNDHGTFRPPTVGERQAATQYLATHPRS